MAELIGRGRAKEGMAVDVAATGEEAVEMAAAADYDSIVLDVLLPGIDGFETCRRLRSGDVWSPVLMLTALDSVEDRVLGLDTGADDYLVKPFAFAELLARLRAVSRRREPERPSVLEIGNLRLDPASRRVWRGDVEVELSAKEFAILESFMRRPDQALTRAHLVAHAWDSTYEDSSNIIDVYIRRLRKKLDEPFSTRTIETVRGAGYRLRSDGGA
jgi:two-component system, OmpR family, response regulator